VRRYLDADESYSPHRRQERLGQERAALAQSVLDRTAQGMAGRVLVTPILRRVLNQAQIHTRERDTMHFELTRLIMPMHRMLLKLGERWCRRGLLGAAEDIFFLELEEIEQLARSPQPAQEKVRACRDESAASHCRPWPDVIRGGREIFAGETAGEQAPDGDLAGVAGNAGVAVGVARIVRSPEEFGKLRQGGYSGSTADQPGLDAAVRRSGRDRHRSGRHSLPRGDCRP
jgi:pyruvate,water dikinase